MTYALVDEEKAHHPVSRLCRVLGVSRAGYHAWATRPRSSRAVTDQALVEQITQIHTQSKGLYGAPKIHAELRQAHGIYVGRKRVARLMREAGLVGCHRRRGPRGTTRRDATARPAPDLVNRQFTADEPDSLWVADVTELPTLEGPLYLASVLDACSRAVAGWAMDDRQPAELVIAALDMAAARRRPAQGLVHHSDQGSVYTSTAFTRRCAELGVCRSMGSVGDCYDNAMAESFFATLECELLDRHGIFRSHAEARSQVFYFIEAWYNRRRRHSALDYLSPTEYERRHHQHYTAAA